MHLAVKTAEKVDSTRPIRSLLYRSSPINIPDSKGNLPIDFANEIQSSNLKNQIQNLLNYKKGFCDCLMLRNPV